jgi:electron transfer flavoprotein alpha subunit
MSVLVIAEHHQGGSPTTWPSWSRRRGAWGRGASLAAGAGADGGGEQAAALTVNRVLLAEHPMLAEGLNDGVDRLLAEVARTTSTA